MAVALWTAQQAAPAGSVPGVSDTAAVIIGTALSLLVLYAIVAAHLQQDDDAGEPPPRS